MDLGRLEFVLKAEHMDFDIVARIDGLTVARVLRVRTGDRLLLGDIHLEKDVSPPWPILHDVLLSHFRPATSLAVGTAGHWYHTFEAPAARGRGRGHP
jgi:hypothetical protein